MFVCLSASISPILYVRSSPNVLPVLLIAVTRSSSGSTAISCVLPVLWMTSYLHIFSLWKHVDAVAASDVITSSSAGYGAGDVLGSVVKHLNTRSIQMPHNREKYLVKSI